jgi:hypothetical protein
MPFPGTKVIPTGWSAHHQPVAAGGMNAEVTIGTRGDTAYDPDTDSTIASWSQEYAGPARIQALTQAEVHDLAGQAVVGRPYLVQLDARKAGADKVTSGMRTHVTVAVNDAQMVGDNLWVVDVQMGSERFTRDLVCTDNQADVAEPEQQP